MSKSERTQRRYRPFWRTQTYLDQYWEDELLHTVQRTGSTATPLSTERESDEAELNAEVDTDVEISSTFGELIVIY